MTDPHLDDEALSAALDGEATAAEESHLESCPACRQRIDVLRSVALAVGGPVPPRPAAAVDAAVGAALGAGEAVEATVPAGPTGTINILDMADRRAARQRRASRTLSLAAVGVIVLGAAALIAALALPGRGSSSAKTAARTASAAPTSDGQGTQAASSAGAQAYGGGLTPEATGASPLPQGAQSAQGATIYGTSLGDQADAATLARLVDSRLAGQAAGASGLAGGSGPNGQAAASTTVASPAAAAPEAAVGAATSCREAGATAAGLAGQQAFLRYAAPLRWRGQDAVALVFDRGGGGRSAVVLAVSGCSLLAVLPV
ncbi:MAG TPA: zf-HC2 domain-containing protein [Acidimicrobiales bacterium]|nr:zf-HC2 domain-containing protein [Acidimicrobiales bacterium]